MSMTITVKNTVRGYHSWPDAPDRRAYLRQEHPHEFVFRTTVQVGHGHRDVEFHDLADVVNEVIKTRVWHPTGAINFQSMSCEQIAEDVAQQLRGRAFHVVTVSVAEDDTYEGTWYA